MTEVADSALADWQPWNGSGLLFRSAESEGLRVAELVVPPRFRLHSHTEPLPHVCCVVRGTFVEHERRKPLAFRRGSVRLSPAGATHDIAYGERAVRCVVLHLSSTWANVWADPWQETQLTESAHWARFARSLENVTAFGAARLADIEAWLAERASASCGEDRPRTPSAAGLRPLLDRIHAIPSQPPSLAEAARLAHRSEAQVARMFRCALGETIGQYARRVRAEAARRALEITRVPVSQVAAEYGYVDQSHLTHAMRYYWGLSPRQLRPNAPP